MFEKHLGKLFVDDLKRNAPTWLAELRSATEFPFTAMSAQLRALLAEACELLLTSESQTTGSTTTPPAK
jgi:hypothetical protein